MKINFNWLILNEWNIILQEITIQFIFLVSINNLNVNIIKINNKEEIWSGIVEKIFLGKHYLIDGYELTPDIIQIEKGNSILLQLPSSNNSNYKYIFIRNFIYTFETTDKIVNYCSNVIGRYNYPFAYGEKSIYFLIDRYQFIPYNTIENENIKNKDLTYNAYNFLYNY